MNEKIWGEANPYCNACKTNDCKKIILPFVFRYLANELAAMKVKMQIVLK